MLSKEQKQQKLEKFIHSLKEIENISPKSMVFENIGIETNKYTVDFEKITPRIKSFLRKNFNDGEIKVKESISEASLRGSINDRARRIRNHLEAYLEELEYEEVKIVKEPILDKKLIKIEKELKEKEAEASRRKKVADAKMYGGYIELIDGVRKENRRKGQEIEVLRKKIEEKEEISFNKDRSWEIVKMAVIESQLSSDDVIKIWQEHRAEKFRKQLEKIQRVPEGTSKKGPSKKSKKK